MNILNMHYVHIAWWMDIGKLMQAMVLVVAQFMYIQHKDVKSVDI